jgi:DNA-directed RNA polymerase specialized sigma24 family protein
VLRAWLFQIAVNQARMLRRRNAPCLYFKSLDEATDEAGNSNPGSLGSGSIFLPAG